MKRESTSKRPGPGVKHERRSIYVLLSVIAALLVVLIIVIDGGQTGTTPGTDEPVLEEEERRTEPPSATAPETDAGEVRQDDGGSVSRKPPVSGGTDGGQEWESLFPTIATADRLGTIYIVLDDAGYDLDQLQPYLDLPGAVSIAVLPQLDHSRTAARMIAEAGKTVMLHLPMEPLGSADPGPGAIVTSMSNEQIAVAVGENLATVPGAVGVNNHMGSRATGDERVMEAVLSAVDSAGLFFVDSRTTAQTTGASVAEHVGIRFAERDVFLDNDRDRERVLAALRATVELATRQEIVVAIGHVTTPVLAELLGSLQRELAASGYRLGALDELLPTRLAME